MSFCKKCGNQVNGEKFCKQCGHQLEDQAQEGEPKGQKSYEILEKMKEHKKPLTIGGTALGILLVSIIVLSLFFTPDRTVHLFDEAVQSGDAEQVADLMSFSNDEEVEREDAEGFVRYLNDNPEAYDDLHSKLENQVTVMNEGEETPSNFQEAAEAFFSGSTDSYVTLVKENRLLFFDGYQLEVEPVNLELGSNVGNATVSVGGKEVGVIETNEDTIEAGPFLPGHHNVTGSAENAWGEFETEEQIEVFSSGQHSLNFDAEYINLNLPGNLEGTDFKELDMQFYINGEAVEGEIGENEHIGPLVPSEDKTLMAEVDFPWGTMQTREHTLDQSSFPMDFQMTEDQQDAYIQAIKDHLTVYLDSLKSEEVLYEDYITDDYRESVQSRIDGLFYWGTSSEALAYQSATLGVDDISIEKKEDRLMLGVPVNINIQSGESGDYDAEDHISEVEYGYDFLADFNQDDGLRIVDHSRGLARDLENGIDFDINSDLYVFEESQDDNETEVSSSQDSEDSEESDENQEGETDETVQETVSDRTRGYVSQLIEAINNGDYNLVDDYILSGSSLESDQQGLVERLSEDNITQELVEVTVEEVTENGDGQYEVNTEEIIDINYSDSSEQETYNWTYTVEENDGTYYLSGIE